jgi:hypothetical protein
MRAELLSSNKEVVIRLSQLSLAFLGTWRFFDVYEIIAHNITPILKLFELDPRLSHFIADNNLSNDVVIRYILRELRPDIKEPDNRRVRCLEHIINLVIKVFLFGNDAESLETGNIKKKGH